MKRLSVILFVMIDLLGGVAFALLEFGTFDKLDENLQPIIEISQSQLLRLLQFGIVYALLGALFGFLLWLAIDIFIRFLKRIALAKDTHQQ